MQRKIHPRLKAFLDDKIPVAQFDKKGVLKPSLLLVLAAHACIGILEQGKDNHGEMVELFQSTCGTPQGQPWCLDFVQSIVAYVEETTGLKSDLIACEAVVPFWQSTPLTNRVIYPSVPLPGDLILWEHSDTGKGHCGILMGTGNTFGTWATVEGNTSPSVGIEREGDGVYSKIRKRGGSESFKELGYLRAFL